MSKIIYSRFLILNKDLSEKNHITYDFNFEESVLPCLENDKVIIKVVGKYQDNDIKADIINIILADGTILHKQNSRDRLLHITRDIKEGIEAQESGIRATERGYIEIEPYILTTEAIATFFKV